MTKLNGFVELPGNLGNVIYIRLSSIDAVWSNKNNTWIQLRGCPDSDEEAFATPLGVKEVIALMAAAQDG